MSQTSIAFSMVSKRVASDDSLITNYPNSTHLPLENKRIILKYASWFMQIKCHPRYTRLCSERNASLTGLPDWYVTHDNTY